VVAFNVNDKQIEQRNGSKRSAEKQWESNKKTVTPLTLAEDESRTLRRSVMPPQEVEEKKPKPKAVFADASAMKERVRQNVAKKEYNVADYYHPDGFCQALAVDAHFEQLTLLVIACNALWIWIDTDHNPGESLLSSPPLFQIAEHSFCFFFAFEWTIRFGAFKLKRNGFKDAWFCFDSFLVFTMVVETWLFTAIQVMAPGGNQGGVPGLGDAAVLRLLRLMRLTRMARMARLLRAMPELMILIKGMAVAARSVFFTLCLLVIVLYVFGIAFTQMIGETEVGAQYYSSVPHAMSTLLLHGCFGEDLPDVVKDTGDESMVMASVLMIFVLLASLTVMNMLVGVLCEVVSIVSSVEKEQMVVSYVKTRLMEMINEFGIDEDNNMKISRSEFEMLLQRPDAARVIQEVGVDVVGLVDFADFIFKDGLEMSFPDFMTVVLQLRGSNTATVKDVVDMRKYIDSSFEEVRDKIDDVQSGTDQVLPVVQMCMNLLQRGSNMNMMNMQQQQCVTNYGGTGKPQSRPGTAATRSRPVSATLKPSVPGFSDRMYVNEQKAEEDFVNRMMNNVPPRIHREPDWEEVIHLHPSDSLHNA
jgi:hypothetical protein